MKVRAALDPLSYGVDGLRSVLIGTSHFGLGVDLTVLIVHSAVFMLIGARAFSRIQI